MLIRPKGTRYIWLCLLVPNNLARAEVGPAIWSESATVASAHVSGQHALSLSDQPTQIVYLPRLCPTPTPTIAATLHGRQLDDDAAFSSLSSSFSARLASVSASAASAQAALQASLSAAQGSIVTVQRSLADASRSADADVAAAQQSAASVMASASSAISSVNAALEVAQQQTVLLTVTTDGVTITAQVGAAMATATATGAEIGVGESGESAGDQQQAKVNEGVCSPTRMALAVAGIVLGLVGIGALLFVAGLRCFGRKKGSEGDLRYGDSGSESAPDKQQSGLGIVSGFRDLRSKVSGVVTGGFVRDTGPARPEISWPTSRGEGPGRRGVSYTPYGLPSPAVTEWPSVEDRLQGGQRESDNARTGATGQPAVPLPISIRELDRPKSREWLRVMGSRSPTVATSILETQERGVDEGRRGESRGLGAGRGMPTAERGRRPSKTPTAPGSWERTERSVPPRPTESGMEVRILSPGRTGLNTRPAPELLTSYHGSLTQRAQPRPRRLSSEPRPPPTGPLPKLPGKVRVQRRQGGGQGGGI